ncbi:MAG: IS6 family transposase [Litoreibacter sp.]
MRLGPKVAAYWAKTGVETLVSFKGRHYPKSVILYAVYFYVRFGVSYRDLEEIMAERSVAVDHATLNRWVGKYAGAIADEAHPRKSPTSGSWRMDESFIKVKGKWTYLYRAIDKHGQTLDFMLSEHRDEATATAFFAKLIGNNGWPDKVVIDKSGSNAAATLAGIEVAHMTRKAQFHQTDLSGFEPFAEFAG